MKLRTLTLTAIVGTLGLAACGSDDTASPATLAAQAAFNEADVTFAQGMIPHHEQAIEMADMALDPTVAASEQVRDLATRIKGGQDPETTMMTGWLGAWGQPIQMDTGGAHDMSSMDGMMSADEMDSLGGMKGAEFDDMWLTMMIRHHEGAIAMAETVKVTGSSAEVLALADQVIAAQRAEITEMQTLLGG